MPVLRAFFSVRKVPLCGTVEVLGVSSYGATPSGVLVF